ncbi:MAG: polysaccharide biosynthesis/export family protein [Cyclobacteriaceae bacterium]|nr:polysaccharide biosynthesis/export family protein [Cyclobacteriaceae bacterium]
MRNLIVIALLFLSSCASYKANIMFKSTETVSAEKVQDKVMAAEKNFVIQKNDRFTLTIYSNKGERLIDPNPGISQTNQTNNTSNEEEPEYSVDLAGTVSLPMIGAFKIEGLTIRKAEEALQKAYESFFKEPFIKITLLNKRVFVLGAPGGQVITLENENTSLIEVLSLAKGIDNNARAENIRLIRGEQVFEIDLSTIEGFRKGNLLVQPGDIVYVEPIRRPFSEGLRDSAGIISLLISLATLITLLSN